MIIESSRLDHVGVNCLVIHHRSRRQKDIGKNLPECV